MWRANGAEKTIIIRMSLSLMKHAGGYHGWLALIVAGAGFRFNFGKQPQEL
ncbi:hypothetical protein GIX45_05225 [Erwinia sp. CPCC 100877]|nr:hypothetical protein [Erwinia sp. CPCC 100877]